MVEPIAISAPPEAIALSEQKRREALDRIERARCSHSNGDLEGAQSEADQAWLLLDEAISICPSNHRARFLLVSFAMNADEYQRAKLEAIQIYHDLTKEQLQQMNDSVLHLSIAHAAKMLGEMEFAIDFALEATQLYSDDPQPYMVLGELHEHIGQNEEAEQKCRQALMYNADPNCRLKLKSHNVFFTLCCLGSCLVKQGKFSEAEMFIHQAIRIDATSTIAFQHLVDVYQFQGRLQEALQIAHKVREMDPANTEMQDKINELTHMSTIQQEIDGADWATKQDIYKGNLQSLSKQRGQDLPRLAERQRPAQNVASEQMSSEGNGSSCFANAKQAPFHNQTPGNHNGQQNGNAHAASELQISSQRSKPPSQRSQQPWLAMSEGEASKCPPKKENEPWWSICCFDRDERS